MYILHSIYSQYFSPNHPPPPSNCDFLRLVSHSIMHVHVDVTIQFFIEDSQWIMRLFSTYTYKRPLIKARYQVEVQTIQNYTCLRHLLSTFNNMSRMNRHLLKRL